MRETTIIPAAQPQSDRTGTISTPKSEGRLIKGTYVSGDQPGRDEAREMGYETVCQHPNEVGILGTDEKLVIDFDHVLFGDYSEAAFVAMKAARAGVTVGIHTYHPHHPLLEPLKKLPGVTIAKTHSEL